MVRGSTWPPLACRAVAGRGQHRPDDVVIAGAPAQVALQGGPDLCLRGRGVLRQQRDRRHDHARGAESALQPVLSPERTLNRMHLVRAGGQSLGRHYLGPVRLGGAGMSMWRTPRWLTASMTAFCAAGAAPIVPASPIPLAPSGLMPVGVSLASSSKLGSSAAVIVA